MPRTGIVAAGVALLWALMGVSSLFQWLALAANLLLLLLILFDLTNTAGEESLSVVREHDPQFSLGTENTVTLRLRSLSSVEMRIQVRDRPPLEMLANPPITPLTLKPGQEQTLEYDLVPTERGEYHFGALWARREGRLGFIVRQWAVPLEKMFKVYPNVKATRKYEIVMLRRRLHELGMRSARSLGAGREFASLREYSPDDEFRSIDWNATARRVKLIVRQYEVERSQQVMTVLDCGRLMSAPVVAGVSGSRFNVQGSNAPGNLEPDTLDPDLRMTKLDFAVNAGLVFSYVALALGDRAGMMTFAEEPGLFLPPLAGNGQLERILENLYATRASTMDSSYAEAYLQLQSRLRKRSLLLFYTDLNDPETAQSAVRYLGLLARKHLCVCVALGDPEMVDWATKVPKAEEEMYRQAVALSTLQDRAKALGELQRRGVKVVDTLPQALTAESVNRYLQVKGAGLL